VSRPGAGTRLRTSLAVLALFSLGAGFTAAVMGPRTMDPRDVSWLANDALQIHLGWRWLQESDRAWPSLWLDRVNHPSGLPAAHLGVLPLLGLALRPLARWWPAAWQHVGAVSALFGALQAVVAAGLLRRLQPDRPALAAFGALFFLMSPALLLRFGDHLGLAGHWTLLAAFWLYLLALDRPPRRWLPWAFALAVAGTGLSAYLALETVLLLLAAVAAAALQRRLSPVAAVAAGTGLLVALAAGARAFGLASSASVADHAAVGLGQYSSNLLTLADPFFAPGLLWPRLAVTSNAQGEGYAYLGLGALVLLAPAAVTFVRRPGPWRRWLPLALAVAAAGAVALSPRVSLGRHVLFEVPVPPALEAMLATVRTSGRFVWPVHYAALLLVVRFLLRIPGRGLAWAAVAAFLALQAADLRGLWTWKRRLYEGRRHALLTTPLPEPWAGLGRSHAHLVLLPSFSCGDDDAPDRTSFLYERVALDTGLTLNSVYAARFDERTHRRECLDLPRSVMDGALRPDTAYVLGPSVARALALRAPPTHACRADGGVVLCAAADQAGGVARGSPAWPPSLDDALLTTPAEGVAIPLGRGSAGERLLSYGWAAPPGEIAYQIAPRASLVLAVAPPPAEPVRLSLRVAGHSSGPAASVDASAGGRALDARAETAVAPGRWLQWVVPAEAFDARGRVRVDLTISSTDPVWPANHWARRRYIAYSRLRLDRESRLGVEPPPLE
jgi:hypothetical protein